MKRSLMVAALMGCTALTPTEAKAGPVVAFFSGIISSITGGALIVGGAAGLGFTVGTFLTTNFFGKLILSYGLSLLARKFASKPPKAESPSDRLVNFAQNISNMEWVFGQVRKGGPYGLTSFQVDRRHYIVILAAHEIEAIDQWYIDNQLVEVEEGVVVTEPFAPPTITGGGLVVPEQAYIGLRGHLGASDQVADAVLVSSIPEWTTAHDMKGLAYAAVFARRVPDAKFSEVYGNSSQTGPIVTCLIRGVLVYDPRTDSFGYSNNAALVWAWVTENRLGAGTVDWDKVAVEADAADVFVTNKEGGTQRKWTLNGSFPDNLDYESIVQQMIMACDGYVYEQPDGKVGFYVGRYIEPTITLTEDDFFTLELSENDFGQNPVTEFVGRYVEPSNDWNESQSGTYVFDSESQISRETIPLFYCHNHNQTMRSLKRIAKSNRAKYRIAGQIGIIALDLISERFVNVNVLGKEFIAEISKINGTEGDTTFEISLASVEPEDFDFVASSEEPDKPPRDEVTNDNTVPVVSSLIGESVGSSGITWSWPEQDQALTQQFRIRKVGDAEWQPSVEVRDGALSLTTTGLTDGEEYEAEIRNVTSARRPGEWTSSGTVVVVSNSTPPDPVVGFSSALLGLDSIELTWNTANDINHSSTRIYRSVGAGSVFADATLLVVVYGPPNSSQSVTNTSLGPETYKYWAVSANSSGVEGSAEGPESETIV